jgi:hypothetical protein
MHEHTGALLGDPSLLHVAVTCAVLAATLFAVRQLAGEWARLHDLATPLAQVGMGAVMVYTMLLPGAQPPIIGIVALLVWPVPSAIGRCSGGPRTAPLSSRPGC